MEATGSMLLLRIIEKQELVEGKFTPTTVPAPVTNILAMAEVYSPKQKFGFIYICFPFARRWLLYVMYILMFTVVCPSTLVYISMFLFNPEIIECSAWVEIMVVQVLWKCKRWDETYVRDCTYIYIFNTASALTCILATPTFRLRRRIWK